MSHADKIVFSEPAAFMRDQMADEVLEALDRRLGYVARMPRMYPQADDERFPGCRVIWVDPCYRVFYRVNAGGPGAYVVAIEEEELDFLGCAEDGPGIDELVIEG